MKWKERREVLKEIKELIKLLDIEQRYVCFTASTISGLRDSLEAIDNGGYQLAIVTLTKANEQKPKSQIAEIARRVERLEKLTECLVEDKKPKLIAKKELE